ncbi:MAG: metallophosphoesterase, partial [Bacteroidales bacterium]|nr:metallophosphoesterase [Bacteroidales bacterium]
MRERKLAITTKISKWLFFLSIASLLLLSTSCDQEDTSGIDGDEDWSFLVYGDLRQGFSIYDVLINSMTRLNPTPAFAVCNGDIMATPNNEVEWLAFWNHTEKLTRQMPVHIVRGNHEGNSPEDERIFREQTKLKTSNIYYSFIENNSLFVLLDTEVPGEVAGILNKQLTWLTNTLDQAKKNDDIIRIFIFMHRPLFPQGAHYGEDMYNAHELHDLFIQHDKIRAVFVSHDH